MVNWWNRIEHVEVSARFQLYCIIFFQNKEIFLSNYVHELDISIGTVDSVV